MTILDLRIQQNLHELYGEVLGEQCFRRLQQRLARWAAAQPSPIDPLIDPHRRSMAFDEKDVLLISYGDSLQSESTPPLASLAEFARRRLKGLFSTIHLLPFFPYSSDDGFSVIDFREVAPALGTWEHVRTLGCDFRLAFDFVLNHVSRQSHWLQRFLAAEAPFKELAISVDPRVDLSRVTRPRALPLLTRFVRSDGSPVYLWTTFSADQVDLNYASPEVLLSMIAVMLDYVSRGAAVLRLDAVAYLWKEIGTSCIHLPQTHQVVRLLRGILDKVAPQVALLTETNVPHAENVSYFGDGYDEAQLVYNFSLPPLLLHALTTGDATVLTDWAATLDIPSAATTLLNFTASHDGIGVRPLEGLLPDETIEGLAELAWRRGGQVSHRSRADGTRRPYELNVTYVDALRGDDFTEGDMHHVERFLASQAVALCLPGVPAIYVGSLLGSRNWEEGVQRSGVARAINRQKLDVRAVETELDDPSSFRARIFSGLSRLIRARRAEPAFHPNASLEILRRDPRCLVVMRRRDRRAVLALTNVSCDIVDIPLPPETLGWTDLLDGPGPAGGTLRLYPYGVAWLSKACPSTHISIP